MRYIEVSSVRGLIRMSMELRDMPRLWASMRRPGFWLELVNMEDELGLNNRGLLVNMYIIMWKKAHELSAVLN